MVFRGPGIPDFDGHRWRYEFCIFLMFWMWYVANSPKFRSAGRTKTLLDAYHDASCDAMLGAGLIDKDSIRAWERDLEERFSAYKGAYEEVHTRADFPLRVTGRGSVGWLVARYLVPGQEPDPRFVLLVNETGSITFQGLCKMVKSLEAAYRRGWRSRIVRMAIFGLMWIPIAWSGFANVREQFGQGLDLAWEAWSERLMGWGLWAVGALLWILLVRSARRFLERKLGP